MELTICSTSARADMKKYINFLRENYSLILMQWRCRHRHEYYMAVVPDSLVALKCVLCAREFGMKKKESTQWRNGEHLSHEFFVLRIFSFSALTFHENDDISSFKPMLSVIGESVSKCRSEYVGQYTSERFHLAHHNKKCWLLYTRM